MDSSQVDGWRVAQWIASGLGAIGALFAAFLANLGRYHVGRLDTTINRVNDIREQYVTRAEFMAAFTRSDESTGSRHTENVQWLRRIEDTMKANADAAAADRQKVSDAVHAMGLQVATLVGRSQRDQGGT